MSTLLDGGNRCGDDQEEMDVAGWNQMRQEIFPCGKFLVE